MGAKQLPTLLLAFGGPVKLYVQDGLGNETDKRGYEIVDTGPPLRRLARMTLGAWRMIRAVVRAKPTVAHFHDPELLPWAVFLRLWGIKVVYDVHEDVPRQVKHNTALPVLARIVLPPIVIITELIGRRLVNGIVAATPVIADRFPGPGTVVVRNYPLVNELHSPASKSVNSRPREFAYIGMISANRNIFGMVDAVSRLPDPTARLRLAGIFGIDEDRRQAEALPGWNRVRFEGWTSRAGVANILADARAGLLVLRPIEHEMVTLPIKLFEYMAAGIPVISSDFPLWREIVAGSDCGLLVDPEDTDAIVRAMQWIIDNPDAAQAMGERGRRAVVERYNWDREAAKLTHFYRNRLQMSENAGPTSNPRLRLPPQA
jgi:glycosyltransferase involved in cell wall biosynthesis